MKLFGLFVLSMLVVGHAASSKSKMQEGNPIAKIIELITDFQAKITRDGEVEQKAYDEFFEWCDDASKEKIFEVQTATSKKEKLSSTIEKATSDIDDADEKIAELSSSTATDEKDLKAATEIREKENADFEAEEKELMTSIDMLGRAIGILEKEMKGSSFLQAKLSDANLAGLLQTMSTVVSAASFSTHDQQRLLALMQGSQADSADDMDSESDVMNGATDSASSTSKSGGIVDTMEDMKEKAEAQLAESRKAEMNAKQNYMMLKMTLEDKLAQENKEMDDTKAAKAEAEEVKAVAEGELEVTAKDLAAGEKDLKAIQMDCMQTATDHEITIKGRKEELKALATAKKIIQKAVQFAQLPSPGSDSPSFLQLSSASKSHSGIQARGIRVAGLVKKLARDQHSTSLAQLASRIEATMRYYARTGDDPFQKVKGLIQEMIAKLMKEAQEEAEEKAYCDTEMKKTEAKRDDLTDEIDGLTAKIDDAVSASTRLKGEVKKLQKELAELEDLQLEMDKARSDANAAFLESSGDLQKGLDGLRKALEVLREYYAKDAEFLQANADDTDGKFDSFMQQPAAPAKHEKSSGAGDAIIGMLEVAESDFAKNLAEEQAEEEAAKEEYEKMTQENKVTGAAKEQDVKYKTKEYKGLDKSVTESSSDRAGAQTELDAVLEYYSKIKEKCIAKPETYEERKKRREAEIAGLKQALSILEGEAVFMQEQRAISEH